MIIVVRIDIINGHICRVAVRQIVSRFVGRSIGTAGEIVGSAFAVLVGDC